MCRQHRRGEGQRCIGGRAEAKLFKRAPKRLPVDSLTRKKTLGYRLDKRQFSATFEARTLNQVGEVTSSFYVLIGRT